MPTLYQTEHEAGLHAHFQPDGCGECWPGGAPERAPLASPSAEPAQPNQRGPIGPGNLAAALSRIAAGFIVDQPDPEPGEPRSPIDGGPMCQVCHGFRKLRRDVPVEHPDFGVAVDCLACSSFTTSKRIGRLLGSLPELMRTWSLETFPCESDQQRAALDRVREWLDDAAGPWLLLSGANGRGKTGLAVGAMRALAERGVGCAFVLVPDLLDGIRTTYGTRENFDANYDQLMGDLRTVSLLVLDDLGKEKASDWATEKLFQVIGGRHANLKRTIVTTNLGLKGISQRLGDPATAQRIYELATERYALELSDLPFLRGKRAAPSPSTNAGAEIPWR
jgi:DNA replication protein DnaC